MKLNGKLHETEIPYLEPENMYIAHVQGYRVYIFVSLERPNVCGQLEILRKTLFGGLHG